MANITLDGIPVETIGTLPEVGSQIKDFKLVATNLSIKTLANFLGNNLIMNIFPSIKTGVCSASIRRFNELASKLDNTKILCISRDLPFSQQQYCAAEGLDNVIMLSDYKEGAFGKNYGLIMVNGAFDALLSRCIIVADNSGKIIYTEQVPDIGQEPDYESALDALKS